MFIKTFIVNALEVNCYLVYDETNQGALIDCGCSTESEWNSIKAFIQQNNIEIKHLLNTHLHFDHVWGNPFVFRDLHISPEASTLDMPLYENIAGMVKNVFGISIRIGEMPPIVKSLKEGDEVTFGKTTLKVFSTPGHSKGGLCFYSEAEGVLFSGDTLFCGSMGRTDLQGGSMSELMMSLRRLAELPDNTKVLCGHGLDTNIGYEKKYNVYMS